MQMGTTTRGFRKLSWPVDPGGSSRLLVQESSIIGDYEDSFAKPGSSYLLVGQEHCLDREQVAELIDALQVWLSTGRLPES